ncbi:MAG: DUF624 domain-containing protein [Lachnospiraceae bacterium]|nr:DUF624 domain-containing protein [Lachnospiraceae bacterium]
MKIFNPDSPFMTVLSRIADFMIINVFTLVLCVPIITSGAALTACYYTMLKIRRDEDSGIVKLYFKSFKENFKQAAVITLIVIALMGIPAYILGVVNANFKDAVPTVARVLLAGAVLLVAFLFSMVFPVLSRFSNTIGGTIKAGIMVAVSNPPRSFLIIIMTVAPFYLLYNFPVILPVVLMFGISLPAFLSVCLYNKQFIKMEERANEAHGIPVPGSEDEHIFND